MTTTYQFDWQLDQVGCECWFHRYHVVHICECGQLLDHSQGTMDEHRQHRMINIPSEYLKHGDTAKALFDRMLALGMVPYGSIDYEHVLEYACNHW